MPDNQDYQQLFNECICKIYDPQPVNTDLQYRLIQFAKMKPAELKDLNDIIQNEDNEDGFEDHNQAIEELKAMRDELNSAISCMEKSVEGSIAQQIAWQEEEFEDPGESLRSEIQSINQSNGYF